MGQTQIARFDKTSIQTSFVSESDSVTYLLELAGATNYSSAGYIKINGTQVSGPSADGLNLRVFSDPTTISDSKSFTLTSTDSSMNTGFVNYINSLSSGVVMIFSGPNLKSSTSIDSWFSSVGSVNWLGSWLSNNYSCGYIAIYSVSRKKIISEVNITTDGTVTDLAKFSCVYDTLPDFGSLGFPTRLNYQTSESSTTSGYEYLRLPTSASITKFSDVGLTSGCKLYVSCNLKNSKELNDLNIKTRVNLRWYKGSSLLDASSIIESSATDWELKEFYSTAPATADGLTIVVSRYPKNDSANGYSGIKNIVVSEIILEDIKNTVAMIGVNGIKSSTLVEKEFDHLLSMDLDSTSSSNVVYTANIIEKGV